METKQHTLKQPVDQRKKSKEKLKISGDKQKRKHNIPKLKG